MAVVYSKVLLFDPPLIYTAPDICVFGAVVLPQRPFLPGQFSRLFCDVLRESRVIRADLFQTILDDVFSQSSCAYVISKEEIGGFNLALVL